MNTFNELDGYIQNTWRQLVEAAKNSDWAATQQAFRKMAEFQELKQQSRNLQQRIERLTNETHSNGQASRQHQTPLATVAGTGMARRGIRRPRELRIGNHHESISINNQIVIATANWMLKQGKTLPKIHNFVHPNDFGFAASAQIRRLDDGSFIEIGDSQDTLIQKARKLLNVCGFPDLKLEVLLEDGTLRSA